MTAFVFGNNVSTTLAASISSSATSITVANATNIPTIPAGDYFVVTLNDAATGLVYEVMYATAISGTALTVLRGQEGTTAVAWNIGDYVYSAPTAGQMQGLPGLQLFPAQIFTSSGTYTKNPLASRIIVEAIGGGGASGSVVATTSSQNAVAGGGQAGSFVRALYTSGFAGGIPVTIGAGGAAAGTGNHAGGNGGTTSFGSLITCPGGYGGLGGSGQPTTSGAVITPGGSGTVPPTVTGAATVYINTIGQVGGIGFASTFIQGGTGAPSPYGATAGGGTVSTSGTTNAAVAATNPGCGGTGPSNNTSASSAAGANGFAGQVIVYEYA